MDNKYAEFFEEVRKFIIDLEIEEEVKVAGCTEEEIQKIEDQFGKIPLAYKEYLRCIGRYFLFHFFDAEQFSYDDYDDISDFVNRSLEKGKMQLNNPYIPISHRRYEYFRFYYLNDEENPKIWMFDPYSNEDEENLYSTERTLIDTILSFFNQTLRNHTAGFHFVDINETNKNIIKDRYVKWFHNLSSKATDIEKYNTENEFIIKLHKIFMDYFLLYERQWKITWSKEVAKELAKERILKEHDYNPKMDAAKNNKDDNFWSRLSSFIIGLTHSFFRFLKSGFK